MGAAIQVSSAICNSEGQFDLFYELASSIESAIWNKQKGNLLCALHCRGHFRSDIGLGLAQRFGENMANSPSGCTSHCEELHGQPHKLGRNFLLEDIFQPSHIRFSFLFYYMTNARVQALYDYNLRSDLLGNILVICISLAWLSDPTHIKPSAQVVWLVVGQEISNGDVGGCFQGGHPQDMLSDTAMQLQRIFAQWLQNTHTSAPSSTVPDTAACTSLTWEVAIY
eukprot:Gb_08089 [translate_table: standard]